MFAMHGGPDSGDVGMGRGSIEEYWPVDDPYDDLDLDEDEIDEDEDIEAWDRHE